MEMFRKNLTAGDFYINRMLPRVIVTIVRKLWIELELRTRNEKPRMRDYPILRWAFKCFRNPYPKLEYLLIAEMHDYYAL
jgi:hypothetical protein